jgi:hypothetical protein
MRLRLFSCVVAALSVQQAVSIPFDNRAASNSGTCNICIFQYIFYWNVYFILDTSTVQFALTLEHVEVAFYTLGLQLFNESTFISAGYTPIVHRRFVEIFEHEQDHVALLSSLLGEQAPQACNYSLCVFLEWGLGEETDDFRFE